MYWSTRTIKEVAVINHALFITPDTHAHARVLFVPEAVVVA
jgi:hypothetical protein